MKASISAYWHLQIEPTLPLKRGVNFLELATFSCWFWNLWSFVPSSSYAQAPALPVDAFSPETWVRISNSMSLHQWWGISYFSSATKFTEAISDVSLAVLESSMSLWALWHPSLLSSSSIPCPLIQGHIPSHETWNLSWTSTGVSSLASLILIERQSDSLMQRLKVWALKKLPLQLVMWSWVNLFALLSLDVQISKMGSSCHTGSHSRTFVRIKWNTHHRGTPGACVLQLLFLRF